MTHPIQTRLRTMPGALADFICQHGGAWNAARLSRRYKVGEAGQCFRNAALLALSEQGQADGLEYVEGYAMRSALGGPVHHAWCVDGLGDVIDSTWIDPQECSYFGVLIPRERLRADIIASRVWGVFDKGDGFCDQMPAEMFDWSYEASAKRIAQKWGG